MSRSSNSVYKSKLMSLLKRRIMDIIVHEIDDPRIKNCIIKHLELNKDNTIAYVYIENNITKVDPIELEKILMKAKGFIYKKLKKDLIIKRVPDLVFRYDRSTDYFFNINEKINRIKSEKRNKEFKRENKEDQ